MILSTEDLSVLFTYIGHAPLVGRAREMNEARTIWQRASSGEGQVLIISGEPGVGKTRFMRELASAAQLSGANVLTGVCYAEGSAPYAPIQQMIRDFFESISPKDLDLSNETLSSLLALAPSMRSHFSDLNAAQNIELHSTQQRIFDGFVTFCSTLSAQGPLLLCVDDVHWADSDTLYLLRNLARRSHKLPLMIMMTYREAELEATHILDEVLLDLNHDRLIFQLNLERFSREETGDLLADLFSEESTPEFLDDIFSQTEGNPFFIEEICKALIEGGQLSFQDGRWYRPEMGKIVIPRTVRAAIKARVNKLPAPAQEMLKMAAILGPEFDFETLQRASGLDEEALISALEYAVRAQIIAEVKSGRSGAGRFGFVHVLIPTTLRESIMHVRRRRYHLQAAQAIETVHPDDYEALAYHYSEAGDTERARGYYRLAGERARQVAPAEAIRFFRAALELWQEGDSVGRAEITAQLGHILYFVGDVPGALQCFEDAYVLFTELEISTQRGEMQRMIGRMHWERADRELSLKHFHAALAILEEGPETRELAWAMSSISQMHMLSMEDELAIAWGQRAVNLAEQLGAEDVVAHALNNIGSSEACSGDFEKGIRILEQSLQRSLSAGMSMEACRAYYNIGCLLQNHCQYSDARQKMQDLYGYAGKVYVKSSGYLAIFRLVWVDWLNGQWRSALDNRSLMSEFSASLFSAGLYVTWTKRIFAMIDIDLGRVEQGRSVLEESLPSALRANDIQTTAAHLGQLIRVYAIAGQEAKTVEAVVQMLALVSDMDRLSDDSIMPLFYACQQLAEMTHLDPAEEKKRCLALLELLAQRYVCGEAAAALAEAKGCLASGADPATAANNFRHAAAMWESIGRPYDQARALASQGNALALLGEDSAAEAVWKQALQFFNSLAAQLDPESQSAFLNSLLVASVVGAVRPSNGEAPYQKAEQAQRHLTGRELEVLALVAQGLTNAQIAEQLILSPLTVNAHLRSIFNKLDVTTRTAAVHNAMELGLV